MEEFERIVEEEEERIRVLAEEENEAVMAFLRENEGDVTCPLCLEELLAIAPMGKGCTAMICCGTSLCRDCALKWAKEALVDKFNSKTCFACRRPVTKESLKEVEVSGGTKGKAFALLTKGDHYRTKHQKWNFQKAFKCYEKAAELGNAYSQGIVAQLYLRGNFGDFKVTRSIEKARKMAEQGLSKGDALARTTMGGWNHRR